ncbi:MAG: hypothetical protein QME96_15450, partial [Myxococcota bacterium]|nr:hypothetical protein [Myxococcota bacterium]
AAWVAAAALGAWLLAGGGAGPAAAPLRLLLSAPRVVSAEMRRGHVEPGDRVLWLRDGALRACGEVLSAESPVGGATVRLALYPDAGLPEPLGPGTTLTLMDQRATLEWALARVLSAERRAALGAEIRDLLSERRDWLKSTFGPMLDDLVRDAVRDVAAEMLDFARARGDEFRDVGAAMLERAKRRWEPILRDVVWPLVVVRLEPRARSLGYDLWNALPWSDLALAVGRSAGARMLNIFIPEGDEVPTDQIAGWREEYIRRVAIPAIQRRMPEVLDAIAAALVEASADPRVRDALRASLFEDGMGDPRVTALLAGALSAGVGSNPRLRARIERFVDDPRVRRAAFDLAEQIEPRVVRVARSLLIDERTGRLHAEIAMLARARILLREPRWILFDPRPGAATGGGDAPLRIERFGGSRTPVWERPVAPPAGVGAGEAPAPAPRAEDADGR